MDRKRRMERMLNSASRDSPRYTVSRKLAAMDESADSRAISVRCLTSARMSPRDPASSRHLAGTLIVGDS